VDRDQPMLASSIDVQCLGRPRQNHENDVDNNTLMIPWINFDDQRDAINNIYDELALIPMNP